MRARALRCALLALCAAALAAPIAIASARPQQSPAPRRARRVRYRPVGCRPHGLGRAHFAGPARGKLVALTFDDGPSIYTRSFVRMLAAHHAEATFFVIGEQVTPGYRSILRTELRNGDAIGDHTWSHPDLVGYPDVRGQLAGAIGAVRRMTGYTPCVFRPPYGAYDSAVVQTAASLRLASILWNVDPVDWSLPGTAAIEQRVLAQVKPGSIVLSHDGGGPRGQTLAAYPYIIDALRRRGYRFVTVPQLLGYRSIYRPCIARCRGTSRHSPPAGAIVKTHGPLGRRHASARRSGGRAG